MKKYFSLRSYEIIDDRNITSDKVLGSAGLLVLRETHRSLDLQSFFSKYIEEILKQDHSFAHTSALECSSLGADMSAAESKTKPENSS